VKNPIAQRELIDTLRTRKALGLQVAVAVVFTLLVLARWPTDAQVDLSCVQSQQVFRLFGYGLLTTLILLAPVFPASTLVREKNRGTLALLLNSPMSPWAIYSGKLFGVLGFAFLLLFMSVPAATACYALGGISLTGQLMVLYGILALVAVQYSSLALLVSSYANSTDSALRMSYGAVLMLAIVTLGPHLFLQGTPGQFAAMAAGLRCASPVSAVMEVLGHADIGSQGLMSESGVAWNYVIFAVFSSIFFLLWTVSRLNYTMLDRARPQGVITDERSTSMRLFRRLVFVVDPQRRKPSIGPFVNPVMIKEFRSRRFGRLHWILRLVAVCALISLGLTYATTAGTIDWGVQTIAGIMVILQVALIVLLTPSLAAGLISSERESGGWELLQMTPLSTARILSGKLMSVVWTLLLILLATLPGYLVIIYIDPNLWGQISRVLICLALTAALALTLSAAVSSLCRKTTVAMTVSYVLLLGICAGTMIVWMGRGAPFGHSTVEAALLINPMAAALSLAGMPGFTEYTLVPASWQITGSASVICLMILFVRTWRLARPQ
jgi:ABC-type transport system involved in multi-copper enzyme maturation permease subunit